jgi:Flp pilus assembly protein TadG
MMVEQRSGGTVRIAAHTTLRRPPLTRDDRGQALIEMGIVVVLFVLLVLGVLEFGRAFMVANMITHAARDGARSAAVVSLADRDPDTKVISGAKKSAIEGQVIAQIESVLPNGQHSLSASVTQDEIAGAGGTIPVVQVTVTGDVTYLFNLVGDHFGVTRTVTFRDEGR